jgi:hypothetical protein
LNKLKKNKTKKKNFTKKRKKIFTYYSTLLSRFRGATKQAEEDAGTEGGMAFSNRRAGIETGTAFSKRNVSGSSTATQGSCSF